MEGDLDSPQDLYIRIPSDLFGQRRNRHAPCVTLPMSQCGRSAGVYPPPTHPLPHPEPWTLQSQGKPRRRDPGPSLYRQRSGAPGGHRNHDDVGHRQGSILRSRTQSGLLSRRRAEPQRMQADEVLDEERGVGEGRKNPDDDDIDEFIDLVARANNVPADSGTLLPELRTSPCAMHPKHLPSDRRDLDLLYNTSCHGGKVSPVKVKLSMGDGWANGVSSDSELVSPRFFRCAHSDYPPRGVVKDKAGAGGGGGGERGWREGRVKKGDRGKDTRVLSSPRRAGVHQQYTTQPRVMAAPAPVPAKLPAELPPSDVVMTWLKHGSAPTGESHFPDITQPASRTAARRRHQHSDVTE